MSFTEEALLREQDLRAETLEASSVMAALPRSTPESVSATQRAAGAIVEAVRAGGWGAIRELSEQFDGLTLKDPRVPASALRRAAAQAPSALMNALALARERLHEVSLAQLPSSCTSSVGPGAQVTLRWEPIERVGTYCPGGRAVYPSSVLMNIVPALAAGVSSLALCSPPRPEHDGLPHPAVLAAASLVGVEEVYAIGGAQAIAAMAFGVPASGDIPALPKVAMITGPGNNVVAEAKRLVQGVVSNDAQAGATEIAIVADATAPAPLVAADLISQAEHDPAAAAVLITDSPELLQQVQAELVRQVECTTHRQRVLEALQGPQSGALLVSTLAHAVVVANAYAPEHLEVMCADAATVAAQIRSAGAIFVGPDTPVSLGDYCAGSNHVLPTGGTAAFSSGLGVHSFLRRVQQVTYTAEALGQVAEAIDVLAQAEGLPAHADAIRIRQPVGR